jgi:hypothetical protein
MFEQLSDLLRQRLYLPAGAILSSLGSMFLSNPLSPPDGFYNALVNIAPLDDVLHVFILVERDEDFSAFPGDPADPDNYGPIQLRSKSVHLSQLWDSRFLDGIILHILHTRPVAQVIDLQGVSS